MPGQSPARIRGSDENQDTVAALEVDRTSGASFAGYVTSSLRQAEKESAISLLQQNAWTGRRDLRGDVREVISGHFAKVSDHDEDLRTNARRLIALGVCSALPAGRVFACRFGGSCGSYPGSCYGHSHQSFFDQVASDCWGSTTSTRIIRVFQVSGFWWHFRGRPANWQYVIQRRRCTRSHPRIGRSIRRSARVRTRAT